VGAALIHEDRRTDMTKVIGTFRYANAPNKSRIVPCLSGSQWTAKRILLQYLLSFDSYKCFAVGRH
jgi:hypothetical protein